MANGKTAISSIKVVDNLGSTPARVNRRTGEMFINKQYIGKLSPTQWKYILFHEAGHATLKTRSEDAADEFASYWFCKRGLPLSASVKTLTQVLSENGQFKSPQHKQRALNQLNRVAKYDYFTNNNANALNILNNRQMNYFDTIQHPIYNAAAAPYSFLQVGAPEYDNFLGIGKNKDGEKSGGGFLSNLVPGGAVLNFASNMADKLGLNAEGAARRHERKLESLAARQGETGESLSEKADALGLTEDTPAVQQKGFFAKYWWAVVIGVVLLVGLLFLLFRKKAKKG